MIVPTATMMAMEMLDRAMGTGWSNLIRLIFDWIIKLTPDILSSCGGAIHLKYTGCFLNG